jgi:tripartite ATP-independent transporter DctP family solute receptor
VTSRSYALALFLLLSAQAFAAAPSVAKFSTVAPDDTPWSDQMKAYKARVEKATQGRVKLRLHLGSALGDENVTASETKRGAIQLWGGSTGALASLVPELALFELPYLFRRLSEADHVIDKVLNEDMRKVLDARGFVLLFWAENGFRSFGSTFGPVKTLADIKGKKMRSQESDVQLEIYRALGASPVPIAVTEVLSSLQTRVVDGFDNTPLFTFAASWYHGIQHFTLSEHTYQPGVVVANKAWFQSLSPEDQKVLLEDAEGEARRGRLAVRELNPLLIQNFTNAKIQVHRLTEAEKDALAKATEPVYAKWVAGKGKAAAAMVKKARAALAELRTKQNRD